MIDVTTLVQVDERYSEATGSVAGVTINTLTFSLGRVVVVVVVIILGGSVSSSSIDSIGSSSSAILCLSSADEVSISFGFCLLRVTYLEESRTK